MLAACVNIADDPGRQQERVCLNIIIQRDRARRAQVIGLPGQRLWWLLAPVAAICVAGAFQLSTWAWMVIGDAPPWADRQALLAEVQAQRDDVTALRDEASMHLDALALRLGELQARSARLEALGVQLVTAAEIDASAFDLSESPAIGGPAAVEDDAAAWSFAELDQAMISLDRQLALQQGAFDGVGALLRDRQRQQTHTPAGRPVDSGWISSGFGRRSDPFHGRPTTHRGVDFAGRLGSDVMSVADGVVVWARRRSGYGKLIEVDHGNGYITRYAHLQDYKVRAGERVRAGQVIAELGASGRATGPHVHFEVLRDSHHVNPMDFIRQQRPVQRP
jgi:murein DD-endopeptidase MepM/ murein hydrolase activator NlpD